MGDASLDREITSLRERIAESRPGDVADAASSTGLDATAGRTAWNRIAWKLCRLLLIRYVERGGDPADRDEAVDIVRRVAGASPAVPDARAATVSTVLGVLLVLRVMPAELMRPGRLEMSSVLRLFSGWRPSAGAAAEQDLDDGIVHLTRAMDAGALPARLRPTVQGLLGAAFMLRGTSRGDAKDMERALALMSEAIPGLSPGRAPGPAGAMNGAASGAANGVASGAANGAANGVVGVPDRPGLMRALIGMTADELARIDGSGAGGRAAALPRTDHALETLGKAWAALGDHSSGAFVAAELCAMLARRAHLAGRYADLNEAWKHVANALTAMEQDDHLLRHHPVYDDFLRTLAGMTVSSAALTFDHEKIDALVDLGRRVTARPGTDPGTRARDHFLAGTAMALRGLRDGSRADEAAAIDQLRRAAEGLPPGDDIALSAVGVLGGLLFDRHGRARNPAAADFYFARASEILRNCAMEGDGLDSTEELAVLGMGAYVRAVHGWRTADAERLDEALRELGPLVRRMPDDFPSRGGIHSILGIALVVRALLRGELDGDNEGLGILEEEAERAAADLLSGRTEGPGAHGLGAHGPAVDIPGPLVRGGYALIARTLLTGDDARLDRGIELLGLSLEAHRGGGAMPVGSGRLHGALGSAHLARRARRAGRGEDGDADFRAGVHHLERARELLKGRPGDPAKAAVLGQLARLYRERGDIEEAVSAGFAALGAYADDVMLRAGPESARAVAQGAADLAHVLAGWCLAEDRRRDAVAALELGRELVVHTATETRGLPEMLDALGRAGAAAEWRAYFAKAPRAGGKAAEMLGELLDLEPPDDLREHTLGLLLDGTGVVPFHAVPSMAEMAAALRATGSDALVYLMYGPDGTSGRALAVRATGELSSLELPSLNTGRKGLLVSFAEAKSALRQACPAEHGEALSRFGVALQSLCAWAGEVVRPLLDHVDGWGLGREPRLTLVPYGDLDLVPWHAARLGAGPREVILRQAVITYRASARHLVDGAARRAFALQGQGVITDAH
ncbi:hypothetical protein [Actinomadura rubrisoli]|uniref:CHAT domain-containing protein n=1 Tax=Actinomadura rubrisoli TaxID=2530368 RepID=A0A4R5B8M0_9ACTN|nr:hypothetical protein [Actinomadura rubrisoli]TDD82638.1 hypothetical protein E1298_22490 [Actinomadura rubrisoli]